VVRGFVFITFVIGILGLLPLEIPNKQLSFLLEVVSSFSNLMAIFFLAFTILISLVASRSWGLMSAALILAILHGQKTISFSSNPEVSGESLRIFYANVWIHNEKTELVRREIADSKADLVLLTEINQDWIKELQLEKLYPYSFLRPGRSADGAAIYSRYPLVRREKVPEANYFSSFFVELLLPSELRIPLYFVHAPPPQLDKDFSDRATLFSQMSNHAERQSKERAIMVGDFNTSFSSQYLQRISNILGLKDSSDGKYLFASWHIRQFPLIRTKIDHLFHGTKVQVERVTRIKDIGSDHYPIVWDLKLN